VIGQGNFGVVKAAQWNPPGQLQQQVAVKVLLSELKEARVAFAEEAALAAQFDHKHVSRLLGVVTAASPMYLVLELYVNGSLHSCLTGSGKATIQEMERIKILAGVAEGMQYLGTLSFVHRDLASRNVLLDVMKAPRVSDFGMSRKMSSVDDVYASVNTKVLPLRWTSPEALETNTFSAASDVFSFGIVTVEVYTDGAMPYGHWDDAEVVRQIKGGYKIRRPEHCPTDLYKQVVNACLNTDPQQRPVFKQLARVLTTLGGERGITPAQEQEQRYSMPSQEASEELYNEPGAVASSVPFYLPPAESSPDGPEEETYAIPVAMPSQVERERRPSRALDLRVGSVHEKRNSRSAPAAPEYMEPIKVTELEDAMGYQIPQIGAPRVKVTEAVDVMGYQIPQVGALVLPGETGIYVMTGTQPTVMDSEPAPENIYDAAPTTVACDAIYNEAPGNGEAPVYAGAEPVPTDTYDSVPMVEHANAPSGARGSSDARVHTANKMYVGTSHENPDQAASDVALTPAAVGLPIHADAWLERPAASQNDAEADLVKAALGFGSYCFRLASQGGLVLVVYMGERDDSSAITGRFRIEQHSDKSVKVPDVKVCGDTRFASLAVLLKYLRNNSLTSVGGAKAVRLGQCIPFVDEQARKERDTEL
jgi:serine/threonine protein kinase